MPGMSKRIFCDELQGCDSRFQSCQRKETSQRGYDMNDLLISVYLFGIKPKWVNYMKCKHSIIWKGFRNKP